VLVLNLEKIMRDLLFVFFLRPDLSLWPEKSLPFSRIMDQHRPQKAA
jgi:hypothetical protein